LFLISSQYGLGAVSNANNAELQAQLPTKHDFT